MAKKPKKEPEVEQAPPEPEFKPLDLVAVTWMDAWFDLDTPQDCKPLTTHGYIIHYDDEFICVASEGTPEDTYFRCFTSIPACLIESTYNLLPLSNVLYKELCSIAATEEMSVEELIQNMLDTR